MTNEFTIEGPPKNSDEYWQTSYYNQRRDRLADIVGDYLNDENIDSRQCYEEILAEVDGWLKYHKKFYDKALKLKTLMLGHREFELDTSLDYITGLKTDKIFIQE